MTIQDIDKVWAWYTKLRDNCEQHDIPVFMMWDARLSWGYNDLHREWNDHHAEIFMNGMRMVFRMLGLEDEFDAYCTRDDCQD